MSWRRRKKPDPPALIASGGLIAPSGIWQTFPSFQAVRGIEMPEEKEVKDLGLAIEPIVGFREFRVFGDAPDTLTSFNGVIWPQREPLQAYCSADCLIDHDSPYENCQCGIYAWKPGQPPSGKVFGEVYLWGDVLICEDGYRAEFAYPKSVILRSTETRTALRIRDGLREAYGIPVTIEPQPQVSDMEIEFTIPPQVQFFGFNTTGTNPSNQLGT